MDLFSEEEKRIDEEIKKMTSENINHVIHCGNQLIRFAIDASVGLPFRAMQFGYNLGRLQELVHSDHHYWWKIYEPLINDEKYAEVIELTTSRFNKWNLKFLL